MRQVERRHYSAARVGFLATGFLLGTAPASVGRDESLLAMLLVQRLKDNFIPIPAFAPQVSGNVVRHVQVAAGARPGRYLTARTEHALRPRLRNKCWERTIRHDEHHFLGREVRAQCSCQTVEQWSFT